MYIQNVHALYHGHKSHWVAATYILSCILYETKIILRAFNRDIYHIIFYACFFQILN